MRKLKKTKAFKHYNKNKIYWQNFFDMVGLDFLVVLLNGDYYKGFIFYVLVYYFAFNYVPKQLGVYEHIDDFFGILFSFNFKKIKEGISNIRKIISENIDQHKYKTIITIIMIMLQFFDKIYTENVKHKSGRIYTNQILGYNVFGKPDVIKVKKTKSTYLIITWTLFSISLLIVFLFFIINIILIKKIK
jgi:hypothetical protein